MMTMKDYELLQRIEREKEDGKARRRIVRRQYTREERKRKLHRTYFLILIAGLCVVLTWSAMIMSHTGDPTRKVPLQQLDPVEELPPDIPDPEPVETGMEILGEFVIVAYCSCEKCCGQWSLNRPLDENGQEIVYTASGAKAEAGVTVAVDPDVIPLGTDVYIEGMGWYVAQDTGNFTGNVIDVYFNDHAAAYEFGMRNAIVSIVIGD